MQDAEPKEGASGSREIFLGWIALRFRGVHGVFHFQRGVLLSYGYEQGVLEISFYFFTRDEVWLLCSKKGKEPWRGARRTLS